MGNSNSIKLNKYKLLHLFHNIRKLNGGKNLLAKKLGITPSTLDEYLRYGDKLLTDNDELLEPIYELDIDAIDEDIEKRKNDYIPEFLEKEGYNMISDKNKNAFEVFFIDKKETEKEAIIYRFQEEIINNITWSEDEKENKKIVLLMLFKLIYDRAQMSLDEELIYLKNKYTKSSTKHVAFVVKDLERRNKEDFGEEKQKEQKQITVNQQFNNFTHFSIEREKNLGLIDKKDEDVIDIDLANDDD